MRCNPLHVLGVLVLWRMAWLVREGPLVDEDEDEYVYQEQEGTGTG